MTEQEQAHQVLPRIEVLREAAAIIAGDRDKQYGSPKDNFSRIAVVWEVITGRKYSAEEVAMMMVGLKVARFASNSGFQPDTWRDIAGYAGCGYEVGQNESNNQSNNDQQ
jgi:hypothetical protein